MSSNVYRIITLIGIILIITAGYIIFNFSDNKNKDPHNNRGSIGGEFTLIDRKGNSVSSNQLKGSVNLVYFGFSYCPDVCPTMLQKITRVVEVLEKYNIKVTPVFITLDPKRDTPETIDKFLSHFHKDFVGLTGSEEQVKQVTSLYKVFYEEANKNTRDYMINHSSFIYIMDKEGNYSTHYNYQSKAEEIVEYIRVHH